MCTIFSFSYDFEGICSSMILLVKLLAVYVLKLFTHIPIPYPIYKKMLVINILHIYCGKSGKHRKLIRRKNHL